MNLLLARKKLSQNLTVIHSGNSVYTRIPWDGSTDLLELTHLVNTMVTGAGPNLENIYFIPKTNDNVSPLNGATFAKGQTDDCAPPQINNTYIGANHGASFAVNITATSHGKTVQDVGSVWKDGNNIHFTIMQIVDSSHLLILSDNSSGNDLWTFTTTVTGTTLTHVSGATHTGSITLSSPTTAQLLPGIRTTTKQYLLNGTGDITNTDGVWKCNHLDIIHNYDILDLTSLLAWVKTQVGSSTQPDWTNASVAAVAQVSVKYSWYENGGCTIDYTFINLKQVNINNIGFVQAEPVTIPGGGTIYYYIPGLNTFTVNSHNYNFSAIQDVTSLADNLSIDNAKCISASAPSYRFIAYAKTSGGAINGNFGFSIGYCPEIGAPIPATRSGASAYVATIWSSTKKVYPNGITNYSTTYPGNYTMPANSTFRAVAYRCPINYNLDTDATNISWYTVGKTIYLMMDYHKNVSKTLVLPKQLQGKSITVIDKHANFTLNSTRIDASGLSFAVTGGYGYAVLKLQ